MITRFSLVMLIFVGLTGTVEPQWGFGALVVWALFRLLELMESGHDLTR